MAQQKHILSLGFNFPAGNILNNVEEISITSNRSLCDADIIILKPSLEFCNLEYYNRYYDEPQQKNINHWQEELDLALEDGKNIFVFLSEIETDDPRNRNNYHFLLPFLPFGILGLADKKGSQIKIAQIS